MYEELKKTAFDRIGQYEKDAFAVNDFMADNPEVSGREIQSSAKIAELLKQNGFSITKPYVGLDTAFRAEHGTARYGRKVAILAEYDALPGIGHGCGHCGSGAASMLAGIALAPVQEKLNVNIDVFGTPDEEADGAKVLMVNDGVFNGYDMAIMVHMGNKTTISPGFIAMDSYIYTFTGHPAHAAATPWEGRNALNASMLMFHAIDMLRQHIKPDARIHGIIRHGGDAPNIVPHSITAEFYIRAKERAYVNELARLVDDCARGAAVATQTTYEKTANARPYDNFRVNKTGEAVLADVMEELGLKHGIKENSGSSDIGNVSYVCPAFHPTIQNVEPDISGHTAEFAQSMKSDMTHKAIVDAAKIISLQILKIFSDDSLFEKMKADFSQPQ